jgi:hypothetical protein
MGNITVTLNRELDAIIYTLEEGVDYNEIRDMIAEFYKGTLTKYTVWDWTKVQKKHLSSEETTKLGQQVSVAGKARAGGYDLIVVPGLLQYGLARIYAVYAGTTALKVNIFRKLDDALDWIRKNTISSSHA